MCWKFVLLSVLSSSSSSTCWHGRRSCHAVSFDELHHIELRLLALTQQNQIHTHALNHLKKGATIFIDVDQYSPFSFIKLLWSRFTLLFSEHFNLFKKKKTRTQLNFTRILLIYSNATFKVKINYCHVFDYWQHSVAFIVS